MTPRLSAKEYEILIQLSGGQKLYGLELVKGSNGTLKRGTIYVTLNRLVEDKGFLKSEAEEHSDHPGLPRKRYSITGLGQAVLRAHEAYHAALNGGPLLA